MNKKLEGFGNEVIEVPAELFSWYCNAVRNKLTAHQRQVLEFTDSGMIRRYILLLPVKYYYHPEDFKVEGWWGEEGFLKKHIKDYKVLTVREEAQCSCQELTNSASNGSKEESRNEVA
jgi:hypothetical protein